MENEIINFATWYSGMEREKVERAYKRYLHEVKSENMNEDTLHKHDNIVSGEKIIDIVYTIYNL